MMTKTAVQMGNELLGIVQQHCPTGKEQRQVTEIYWAYEMNKPGSGLRAMAGLLYDGLTYGNWPWVVFPTNTPAGSR